MRSFLEKSNDLVLLRGRGGLGSGWVCTCSVITPPPPLTPCCLLAHQPLHSLPHSCGHVTVWPPNSTVPKAPPRSRSDTDFLQPLLTHIWGPLSFPSVLFPMLSLCSLSLGCVLFSQRRLG